MVVDKDHQRKLQRVKNYTATIGVHDAASTCNLHKGMPLNFCPYPQFNGMPLCKLTCADAQCVDMKGLERTGIEGPFCIRMQCS